MTETFGEAIAEVLSSQIDNIKKAALIRTVFSGQNILVDYNWSVKAIVASDQLRQQTLNLVAIEFLIMDRAGKHLRHVAEFSEEEFIKFYHQLVASSQN